MAIKVIIKRTIPKSTCKAQLDPLLEVLRDMASKQKGYFYGETLRSVTRPEEQIVLSTWDNIHSWLAWAGSRERALLQAKIDEVLGTTTEYSVYRHEPALTSEDVVCDPIHPFSPASIEDCIVGSAMQ